jgi:hypothetical protein
MLLRFIESQIFFLTKLFEISAENKWNFTSHVLHLEEKPGGLGSLLFKSA